MTFNGMMRRRLGRLAIAVALAATPGVALAQTGTPSAQPAAASSADAALQAVHDDVRQRRNRQHLTVVVKRCVLRDTKHPTRGRIQDTYTAIETDHYETSGEAGNDLAGEALRRLGAGRCRAFLCLECGNSLLEGRGEEVGLTGRAPESRVARSTSR